jgi:uncharacterized caspase-like protein
MNGNRWALVVGACDYEFHPSLRFAASDAVAFADALVGSLAFDRKRVLVLADTDKGPVDYTPTRRNIFHALGLFGNKSSRLYSDRNLDPIDVADQFVFYYSGHGIRHDRAEFLVPVDASDCAITETAVPLEEVVARIDKLPCQHKVLFLDACREQFFPEDGSKAISGAKGIGDRELVKRRGLATFYSCDPGQLSFEIDDLEHGSFTYCLLEAVKDREINTLGELDRYLKAHVPTQNSKANKALQQPFSVPSPSEMLDVDLLRVALIATDSQRLMEMTTELANEDVIDPEWWAKLCDIWDTGQAANYALKRRIFERLYDRKSTVEEFQRDWNRTERYTASASPAKPDLSFMGVEQ